MAKCQDCECEADPDYTMDFTDVEAGAYIYWCPFHGEEARAISKVLNKRFEVDPTFASRLELEIEKVKSGGVQ